MPNAQTAGEVVKALSDCGMNLSPFVENDAIMVPVPKYVPAASRKPHRRVNPFMG
jgi:hypothetical protein